jgi:hypothetical protein
MRQKNRHGIYLGWVHGYKQMLVLLVSRNHSCRFYINIQGVTHQKQSLDFSKETGYMTRRLKSIQNFNVRPGPGPKKNFNRDQKKVILQMPSFTPFSRSKSENYTQKTQKRRVFS